MKVHDPQVLGAPSVYGDFFVDGLLRDLLPLIKRASGLKLFPTYSYFRVYKPGDVLAKHKDRPACEISVTLSIGYQANCAWPMCLEGPNGSSSVSLSPGDGLMYRGMECSHWREALDGDHVAQVFLHYVDQMGPHAECGLTSDQT